jgi:hypothetical protein
MTTNLTAFQQVLEALQMAQTMGAIALLGDKTTFQTDDQDCYPRGLALDLDRKDPKWHSLRFLSKHLDWVNLDTRTKHLYIGSPEPIEFRLAEVCYLQAVSESLNENGINCTPDVYYR